MDIYNNLEELEKMSVWVLSGYSMLFIPAAYIGKSKALKIIVCFILLVASSLLVPTLGIALAAFGMSYIGYFLFFTIPLIPIIIVYKKAT
jgi:hypothetical protein